jgi:hypothetical protein
MTSNANTNPATLREASYAALNCRAVSDNAHSLVSALYEQMTLHESATGKRRNARVKKADSYKKAIEGFVGDLLLAQAREKGGGWVYRSTRRDNFTGEAVSYRHFKRLLDSLVDSNLIKLKKGFQPRTKFSDSDGGGSMASRSWAPRFRAKQSLLKLAEQHGVQPSEAVQHFIKDLPKDPLQVRARSMREGGRKVKGPLIKWREVFNAKVRQRGEKLEAEVKELNEFLDKIDIRGGAHRGYVRVFNNGDDPNFSWSAGGRLYSGDDSYQRVQRSERLRMTLNGEPVCEIDIRASYLTIYHAIHNRKLDLTNDPYVLPKLGQDARPAVKAWFVTTFGSPKHISRWPKATKQDFREETGRDLSEYPIKTIREEVFKSLPLMCAWGTEKAFCNWSFLMWLESRVMVSAMLDLKRNHSVPSITVFDSLIVPTSKRTLSEEVLRRCYRKVTLVTPTLVTHPEGHSTAIDASNF